MPSAVEWSALRNQHIDVDSSRLKSEQQKRLHYQRQVMWKSTFCLVELNVAVGARKHQIEPTAQRKFESRRLEEGAIVHDQRTRLVEKWLL